MNDKELNQKIADVLSLADAEKQEYVREDLILFARQAILGGTTSIDKILTDFFVDSAYWE